VKPGEVVRFRNGSVANADSGGRSSCGCTKPRTQSAAVAPPADLGFPEQQSKEAAEAIASGRPAPHSNPPIQLPPTSQPGEVQLQIDAPMVFRGDGPAVAEPPMPAIMARKTLKPPAFPEFPELAVQPPALQTTEPATSKPKKRNFFSKFGSAIAWLFKKHDKQIPQR
jgi:hypothetical protein